VLFLCAQLLSVFSIQKNLGAVTVNNTIAIRLISAIFSWGNHFERGFIKCVATDRIRYSADQCFIILVLATNTTPKKINKEEEMQNQQQQEKEMAEITTGDKNDQEEGLIEDLDKDFREH
jgi:hypothetical protein